MATTTPLEIPTWNFTIKQNADWSPTLTWRDDNGVPIDLTNYAMKLAIKAFAGSPVSILMLSSSSSSGSRIVLGGTAGTIQLVFAHADTVSIVPVGLPSPASPFTNGPRTYVLGVYDLQYVDPLGDVGYLVQGNPSLNLAATI